MTGVFASSRKVLNAGSFHSVAGDQMIIFHMASFGFGMAFGTLCGLSSVFIFMFVCPL
jgi:hypothetical protein